MLSGESDRFRSSYGGSMPNVESEDFVNMQGANEFQTPTEYFVPNQGNLGQEMENEQMDENEVEYELFAHELRDADFEGMALETMQELESNFENFSHQQGVNGELESIVNHSNFENLTNGYFQNSVGHLIPHVSSELDNFSNYIQTNIPVGSEYEAFSKTIDSYQPINSEDFVKKFVRRAARAAKGFVKRGIKKIGSVAKSALKAGKWLVTGPLRIAIKRFINFIKSSIGRILRTFVRRAIRGLPPVARPFFLKAAKRIGVAEYQVNENELRDAEFYNELDSESITEYENLNETIAKELEYETESFVSESELEDELELLQENENLVAELMNNFDRELFNFGEAEINKIIQSQTFSPESYQPESYQPESYQPESYQPESYQPESYQPESYQPESYQPESYQPESYQPESYQPESYQPESYQPESYQPESYQPESYQPESYQPESYQPESYQPESYQPESYQPESYQPESDQPESDQPESDQPESYQPESYQPESYQPESYQPESYQPESYQPESYQPESYQPESYQPESYQPESDQPESYQPESYQPESDQPESDQPESDQPESDQPESYQPESYQPESFNPYTPESYTQESYQPGGEFESDSKMISEAYDRFVNSVTSNPSSFHREFEQFAPAIITGVRIAFKTIPPLRRKVINVIAQLLQKLLGRWVPKHIGDVAYKPLANILLKTMGLETYIPNVQERVFAESMVNTALESLINASLIPNSILEGERYVLEAELDGIVQQAISNNFPQQAIQEAFVPSISSKYNRGIHFVPRNKYQALNKPIRITLNSRQINHVRVKSSLTLGNFLRRFHRWDGKTSITLNLMVFRSLTNRGRPFRILRDYYGKGRKIRIRLNHLRHLHRFTKNIASIFGLSRFWSPRLPMYFIFTGIKGIKISQGVRLTRNYSIGLGEGQVARGSIRGNSVKAGIDTLGRYGISFYLNAETIKKLKSMAGTAILRGTRFLLTKMTSSGQAWLTTLFSRLRIPRFISKGLSKLLTKLAVRFVNKYSSIILRKLNSIRNISRGITISIRIKLPKDFIKIIRKIRPLQIPFLIRNLIKSSIFITVVAGYKI